jgi:hypothetical protein
MLVQPSEMLCQWGKKRHLETKWGYQKHLVAWLGTNQSVFEINKISEKMSLPHAKPLDEALKRNNFINLV